MLASGGGADTLDGGNGNDVMVAGAGDDSLVDGNGNDFLDAGLGNDSLSAGNGNDFIVGGKGNDTIDTGNGNDLIAFNRGDGADRVSTLTNGGDLISLGGGIKYADISLAKQGTNLVVQFGQSDSITLEGWYAAITRKTVAKLQIITDAVGGDFNAASSNRLLNQRNVSFDFVQLVAKFDAALQATPALTSWNVAPSLDSVYLAGSNTQTIGGNMVRRYGLTGSYGDLDYAKLVTALGGAGVDTWQTTVASTTVDPWTALQAGVRLSGTNVGLPTPITPASVQSQEELLAAALVASGKVPSWHSGTMPALGN